MRFDDPKLADLIGAPADGDVQRACERANLLMEERISGQRHKEYEEHMIARTPAEWADWRAAHENYVAHFVRGGNGKDPSTFCLGESTLYRPEVNKLVLRLEDLNELLVQEGSLDERRRDPAQAAQVAQSINTLITESRTKRTDAKEKNVSSFKDLVKLGLKDPVSPDAARLKSLTEALNTIRRDRRPSFIAFDAEFASLDQDNDWLVQFCERCGLSRHFAGYPKVLALFRYKVGAVMSVAGGRPVFAAPTVLDHSFSPGFFPAPAGASSGMRLRCHRKRIARISRRSCCTRGSITCPSTGFAWACCTVRP